MTLSTNSPRRLLTRLRVALLALVAIAAVTAPAASAHSTPPLRSTLEMELDIFDLHLSTACDTFVSATVSFVEERKVVFEDNGTVRETRTMDGRITWYTRDTGKTYSSALVNKTRIDYPEGVDLWKPAKITVTSYHGNTFPIGIGLPGRGTVVYDGLIYAIDSEGFPYTFEDGDPISMSASFAASMAENTQRICAALA